MVSDIQHGSRNMCIYILRLSFLLVSEIFPFITWVRISSLICSDVETLLILEMLQVAREPEKNNVKQ